MFALQARCRCVAVLFVQPLQVFSAHIPRRDYPSSPQLFKHRRSAFSVATHPLPLMGIANLVGLLLLAHGRNFCVCALVHPAIFS